jgi:hypothetical protein
MMVLGTGLSMIPPDLDLIQLAKGLGMMALIGIAMIPAALGIGIFSMALMGLAASLLLLTPVIGTLERLHAIGASMGLFAGLGGETEDGTGDATIKANNIVLDGAAAQAGNNETFISANAGPGAQQPAAMDTAKIQSSNAELAEMIVAAISRANFEIMLDGKKVSKQLDSTSGATGI